MGSGRNNSFLKIVRCTYNWKTSQLRVDGVVTAKEKPKIILSLRGIFLGEPVLFENECCNTKTDCSYDWFLSSYFEALEDGIEIDIDVYFSNKIISTLREKVIFEDIILKRQINYFNKAELLLEEKNNIKDFLNKYGKSDLNLLEKITIEASSLCNLRCIHCTASSHYSAIERCNMDNDLFMKAIETVKKIKSIKTIQFNGIGEPLLNDMLPEMVMTASKIPTINSILFFTNGMLINEEFSQKISKIEVPCTIFISIDGRTPNENNALRVGSDYALLKKKIFILLKNIYTNKKIKIRLNNLVIPTKKTIDEIPLTPRFLLEDFGFLEIDTRRMLYFPSMDSLHLNKYKLKKHHKFKKVLCKRPFNETTIRSNGDVIVCHWDSTCELTMGNLNENAIEEIWLGKKYVNVRNSMLPTSKSDELNKTCQKCHVMNSGCLYRN
jgi:radical SAM protein with 4Fe4S-binding SPASM domain